MVTWRERGAVGCSKCRFSGCRDCCTNQNDTNAAAKKRPPRKRRRKATDLSRATKVAPVVALSWPVLSSSSDEDSRDNRPPDVAERREEGALLQSYSSSSSSDGSEQENAVKLLSGRLDRQQSSTRTSSSAESEDGSTSNCAAGKKRSFMDTIDLTESVSGSSNNSSSDDSSYSDESSRPPRKFFDAATSANDARTSLEIERLLHEANSSYDDDRPLDPYGTLAQAQAKWGSTELLAYLRASICKYCKSKLGIYYERQVKRSKSFVGASICEQCLTVQRQDTWTLEQAAEAFRHDNIISVLQNEFTSIQTEAGLSLYDSASVTRAAIQVYGSVWELQYALAKIRRRSPRQVQL